MPVATAHGLMGWFALLLLGLTALDVVRRRAFDFFKARGGRAFWSSARVWMCVRGCACVCVCGRGGLAGVASSFYMLNNTD